MCVCVVGQRVLPGTIAYLVRLCVSVRAGACAWYVRLSGDRAERASVYARSMRPHIHTHTAADGKRLFALLLPYYCTSLIAGTYIRSILI